jgi:hypothetical protein
MKISAMPPSGVPTHTGTPQNIEVKPSDTITDVMAEHIELDSANRPVKKIKLNVNRTPQVPVLGEQSQVATPEETTPKESDKPTIEDTKPLSPQFAALARQRRALQVKEREIAEREKALTSVSTQSPDALIQRIKSEPLSVLQEYGVTYDQLTQSILDNQNYNPEIQALKAELKAVKEGVDKTLSDKDLQAEQQVLAQIEREVHNVAQSDPQFELIKLRHAEPDVKNLIHRTYKETGEVLDTEEAMRLVEEELTKEALEIVNSNKIKARQQPPQQQLGPKQIKTLTSRDTARPIMDRRARALAAALGQLRK